MASPRALQIAEEEFRASVLDRLDQLESMLGEILSILNPEATEVDDDGAATFGDEPGEETADDGTHGGFMDTEDDEPAKSKRSKSKTL